MLLNSHAHSKQLDVAGEQLAVIRFSRDQLFTASVTGVIYYVHNEKWLYIMSNMMKEDGVITMSTTPTMDFSYNILKSKVQV
jgi:hypothetical protein